MDTTGAAAAAAAGGGGSEEEEDRARLAAIADRLQARDSVRLYTWLSHRCFSDCVTTFYRKTLGKREGDCVRACVRKYTLATNASAARFNKLADPSAAAADDEDG
ncbi:mitochondrial import inner membrane translocase subunit Tim9-like [Hordeum vulgare subsp. vulgare]|uniref:Mitochondrial import inner membrane translocase subunit n=1 Tax=Hordeum vulgare subsp. vulgare TaxID=112509 RepID=A0A8I7B220_HORVV|nr:mitochondrial import inner membrane translocase subunit Tim9-like [Hordeum vulgare subsp. vulgare]